MTRKQFLEVLERYQAGHASKEERDFIDAYYDLLELNADPSNPLDTDLERELLYKVWEKNRKWEQRLPAPIGKMFLYRKIAAVAFILILAGGGAYLLNRRTVKSTPERTEPIVATSGGHILPASAKAVLTLANGQKVFLDGTSKTASSASAQSFVQDSGKLIYKKKNSKARLLQNTLTTPRGGTFSVILSDGTKVWLNAGSSLVYPAAFSRKKRQVKLKGEAYFEVTQDQERPFIVAFGKKSKIQVLGTQFNVRAYRKGQTIKATLAEGQIRVVEGPHSQLLHPGEQAVIQKEDEKGISIKKVNVNQILAWKNNLFFFDHTNIKEIMAELSRWYDVEISFSEEDLKRLDFSGIMSRYGDIQEILDRLALTGTVAFQIEGRKITVIKQKAI